MEHGIDDACGSLFTPQTKVDIWMDSTIRPGSKESINCTTLMMLEHGKTKHISFIFVCIVTKNSSCNCDGLTWPDIFHLDGKISSYVKKTQWSAYTSLQFQLENLRINM